ncbi:PfkB family carbohydrate kinase [Kitasatospora sp. NBC_01287]|uniref:PfkB family carbohydrate kinase n=1 Tax=Kitasatospora sp. NBC_01287 TaxID=2903573 RepID=UPI00225754A9|nr:PfkB family carbohydrate kinase [Kitasatospora sp. NBC_01287]MCX4751296.1 PfkB family carbohydrate kinase [Kitasatospora sp. NBC_01287]
MTGGADRAPSTLVIGEALTDILTGPDGRRCAVPGGSPANVALGLARLGHPVRLATRIGGDGHGRELRRRLGGSGVLLTDGSVVADAATSTATAVLGADGAASYRFDVDWSLPPLVIDLAATGPVDHLHTGSVAALLAPGAARVLAAVRAARPRATVSYDPNLRPALLGTAARERPRVEELVALSDLVKASDEDLGWLYPGQDSATAAARWVRTGPALVVLTRGAGGALAFWRHGSHRVAPIPVEVVDTVGAGDAFMAGLLGGLLRAGLLGGGSAPGRVPARDELRAATGADRLPASVVGSLALAARTAALTCTRPGADPPHRADLAR